MSGSRSPVAGTRRALAIVVVAATAAALAACGSPPDDASAVERQAHPAGPMAPAARAAHLRFACSDGREMLVDFGDGSLRLTVAIGTERPAVLIAAATGQPYVGGAITATFTRDRLFIEAAGHETLVCRRSTKGLKA